MKLTDKEGLEIASVVKDVLEGKAVKKEKKNVKEVEEPNKPSGKLGQDSGERDFKKKHVVKKSGEKADGTVTKEDKAEEAASPEEKAQLALKQAKEKEQLKKKQDMEKEKLANEEVDEEEVDQKEAEDKKAKYQKFFQAALKKFGVKSPAELEGDKKKEFFDYIDKNYEAENESD
tara:strand:+ start:1041 stop:1565 length:525 start_codon:yes stop_codon:yes gene_type:complete